MAGAPQRDDLTRYRRQPALGDGGSFMSSSITQKIRPVCNYVRKGVVCAPGPRALRRGTKRKKRGLRPERSGGSPARGASLGILPWTSTVKPFFESSVQRDADPHGYKEKRVDIYFVNPSWWSTGLQIRTESRRNVPQRHCLGSVLGQSQILCNRQKRCK